MKIGLTGGVCCGKTTALGFFKKLGYETINLEKMMRDALQGKETGLKIRDSLGDKGSGNERINLEKFTESILAGNKRRLDDYESILMPQLTDLIASDPKKRVVVESPLIFEKKMTILFDVTICVYTSQEVQWAYAQKRAISKELFRQQIHSQWSLLDKVDLADFVLGNNGHIHQLERQVQLFHLEYKRFMRNIHRGERNLVIKVKPSKQRERAKEETPEEEHVTSNGSDKFSAQETGGKQPQTKE